MTIEELMQNEEFMNSIRNAASVEEVVGIMRANGIDISVKMIEAMLNEDSDGELDEETLEDVAGGVLARGALAGGAAKLLRDILRRRPVWGPILPPRPPIVRR